MLPNQIQIHYAQQRLLIPFHSRFKLLLQELSQTVYDLPEDFCFIYRDLHTKNIHVACQGDYEIYIRKIQQEEFRASYIPPLYVSVYPKDNFIPMSNIEKQEEKIEKESIIYSEILSQISREEEQSNQEFDKASIHTQIVSLKRTYSNQEVNLPANTELIIQERVDQILPNLIKAVQAQALKEKQEEIQLIQKNLRRQYLLVCQQCHESLATPYFRCLQCYCYSVCQGCSTSDEHNKNHIYLALFSDDESWTRIVNFTYDWIKYQQVSKKVPVFGNLIQQSVHKSIACDGCEQYPLSGTRYKCLQCPDYDLCQKCFTLGKHDDKQHPMLQLSKDIAHCQIKTKQPDPKSPKKQVLVQQEEPKEGKHYKIVKAITLFNDLFGYNPKTPFGTLNLAINKQDKPFEYEKCYLHHQHRFESLKVLKRLNQQRIIQELLRSQLDPDTSMILLHSISSQQFDTLNQFFAEYFPYFNQKNLQSCFSVYVGLYQIENQYILVELNQAKNKTQDIQELVNNIANGIKTVGFIDRNTLLRFQEDLAMLKNYEYLDYKVILWKDFSHQQIQIKVDGMTKAPRKIDADLYHNSIVEKLITLFYK